MESALLSLLNEDISVTTLLLLFIVGLLTKRFVPWWVYDDLVNELNIYKKEAPALIEQVQKLLEVTEKNTESAEVEGHLNTSRRLLHKSSPKRRERLDE